MTPTDHATYTTAIATGREVRISIGDAMLFGSPVSAVVGGGVVLAPRGGGPPQTWSADHVSDVVVLASRVPRPQQRRGTR